MLPKAYVSHSINHRTRLAIPTKRKSKEYFSDLQKELSQCEGVAKVDINPMTGSVLIKHEAELEVIKKYGKDRNIFVVIEERGPPSLDPFQAIGLGLFGLAALQAFRGNFLPPAWPLLRDAIDFYKSRKKDLVD
jgi:hypothetical protein